MGLTTLAGVAFEDHAPAGAAGAPLLLVHGSGGSHADWPEALRRLPGRRVVAVDLPGHGASPPPPERTVAGVAGRLVQLLDALALPRAVVAGHSLGGAVALSMALDAPSRVAGLVLVGTGARLRVTPALLALAADPARATEAGSVTAAASFGPAAPPALVEAYARAVAASPPGALHADLAACDVFDVMARLGEIRAPTLVVVGDADRLTPPKYAAFLRDAVPGARLVVVPGAGHMVAREAAGTVAAAVEAHLASVP